MKARNLLRRTSVPELMTAQRSEEDRRPYMDLAAALFLEVAASGELLFANDHAIELLGWDRDAVVGTEWLTTWVAEESQVATKIWLDQLFASPISEQRTHFETQLRGANGTHRRVEWTQVVIKHRGSDTPRVLMCGHDVTALRQAEASLDLTFRELQIYKFALDASSILAITDHHGRITFANDKFCGISGYTRDELIGQDHRLLNSGLHPSSFFREMWQTIRSGHVWRNDIRNRRKDGSWYWVDTTIVPAIDPNTDKPYEYIAIRNEITERKQMEVTLELNVQQLAEANQQLKEEHQQLLQAEKMASVGLLAAGVAHEVNNPLSGVMACLKALEEDTVRPERRAQYFATARDGLERIQQTVRGLLDFSRQRTPMPALVKVREALDASVRLITPHLRKRGVEVVLSETTEAAVVRADRSQLMQALVNLLLNAAYVSPKGAPIECDVVAQPHAIGLRIADRGPGMSEEVIAHACDPFFSTKPEGEGTGLGLTVTQSIAQAHGGELRLEQRPEPASGTLATLWLPIPENNRANT